MMLLMPDNATAFVGSCLRAAAYASYASTPYLMSSVKFEFRPREWGYTLSVFISRRSLSSFSLSHIPAAGPISRKGSCSQVLKKLLFTLCFASSSGFSRKKDLSLNNSAFKSLTSEIRSLSPHKFCWRFRELRLFSPHVSLHACSP